MRRSRSTPVPIVMSVRGAHSVGERADIRFVDSERNPGYVLGASFLSSLKGVDFVMVAIFTVLAMDGYRANPDRVTALFVAASAAVALILRRHRSWWWLWVRMWCCCWRVSLWRSAAVRCRIVLCMR